jgi:hypothetical protein
MWDTEYGGRDEILTETSVSKPQGEGSLGRFRCRWEGNIKMDFRGIKYYDMECILLAQNEDRRLDRWNTALSLLVYKRRRISEIRLEPQGLAPCRYVVA